MRAQTSEDSGVHSAADYDQARADPFRDLRHDAVRLAGFNHELTRGAGFPLHLVDCEPDAPLQRDAPSLIHEVSLVSAQCLRCVHHSQRRVHLPSQSGTRT
jgi:hypothetical protein